MPYYLVNFTVTLDGDTEYGMIRASGPAYNPNVTKETIVQHYRKTRPTKQYISVVITAKKEVSQVDFIKAESSSI